MTSPTDITEARARRLSRQPLINPLVGEIVDALLALGGAAHRDAVIRHVALARGAPFASDALARELASAFEARLAATPAGASSLLALPFGEGSRRWALTHEALGFLRDGARPLAV